MSDAKGAVICPVYHFEDFQLDCGRFELIRSGRSLRVERKPMELLILLASRAGQLVSRAEIAQRLWSSEVFVDTEHGINTAIRKLRHLLRDDPDSPQFIQTVTGMGYRFIAPITTLQTAAPEAAQLAVPTALEPEAAEAPAFAAPGQPAKSPRRFWLAIAVAVALLIAVLVLTLGPHPLAARLLHRNTSPLSPRSPSSRSTTSPAIPTRST
jgi:DNA-binding winged helix-turn-helix (wHTH) protein